MAGKLINLSIVHGNVSPALAGRIHLDRESLRAFAEQMREVSTERLLLSTCERVEVFGVAEEINARIAAQTWTHRLSRLVGVSEDRLASLVSFREGLSAARHFLRIAAGLESKIIGEPHVLAQVRAAFLSAEEAGDTGAVLSALGRSAIHTGRRARRENAFGGSSSSVVTLALERVARDLGSIHGKSMMIVGTGAIAIDLVRELGPRKPASITLISRDRQRANHVARRLGVDELDLAGLFVAGFAADALIACTASPSVVDEKLVKAIRRTRLSVVDLGMPRNVLPCVSTIEGVTLTHLDQLVKDSSEAGVSVTAAERIVEEELARFGRWFRERQLAPRIAALVEQAGSEWGGEEFRSPRDLHLQIEQLKASVAA